MKTTGPYVTDTVGRFIYNLNWMLVFTNTWTIADPCSLIQQIPTVTSARCSDLFDDTLTCDPLSAVTLTD